MLLDEDSLSSPMHVSLGNEFNFDMVIDSLRLSKSASYMKPDDFT